MDKYVEISTLNEGSYGVVQLVKQKVTSRLYAAKRVSLELSSRAEIDDEIKVHSHVSQHPRVVQLVDHFLDEERNEVVLVLEYCSGGDLHDAIARGEKPSNEGLRRIMLQLLDTLEYCHNHSVYHRDIKPENIFLQHNGNIKLGDWGLATSTEQCSDFGTGSEQYMAPECFDRTAKTYSAAQADIWAAGIVLVNALFGRNPFKEATERDPLFTDFASSRESLYDIFPTLTNDVFRVLRHSLTLNPEHRSIAKMREALLEVENWTTDDELVHLQQQRAKNREAELRAKVVSERSEAKMVPIVHKPFRVPSAVARSLKSPTTAWDRKKMYTPPMHRGLNWSRPSSYARNYLPRHLEEPEEEEEEDLEEDLDIPSSPSSSASSAELSATTKPAHAATAFAEDSMFSMDDDHQHQHQQHRLESALDHLDIDESIARSLLDEDEGSFLAPSQPEEPGYLVGPAPQSCSFASYRARKAPPLYR